MANELKGVVKFLDDAGKEWLISYPANTLIDIEDATGKGISDLLVDLSQYKSTKLLRHFIFFGLRTHDVNITEQIAGDLMSFGSGISAAAMQAIALAFPDAKPTEKKEADDPNA